MPWLFEKPDKCEPSQSSAWTHPRRPDLIRKTRENQVISISSPDLSSVSYFIDIAFIFVLSGRAQPCCRAYKQLYFTGLLCSGVALSFIFSALWFVSFSLFVTHAHTHTHTHTSCAQSQAQGRMCLQWMTVTSQCQNTFKTLLTCRHWLCIDLLLKRKCFITPNVEGFLSTCFIYLESVNSLLVASSKLRYICCF